MEKDLDSIVSRRLKKWEREREREREREKREREKRESERKRERERQCVLDGECVSMRVVERESDKVFKRVTVSEWEREESAKCWKSNKLIWKKNKTVKRGKKDFYGRNNHNNCVMKIWRRRLPMKPEKNRFIEIKNQFVINKCSLSAPGQMSRWIYGKKGTKVTNHEMIKRNRPKESEREREREREDKQKQTTDGQRKRAER